MEEIERKRKAEEERHDQGGDESTDDDDDADVDDNDDGEAETDDDDDYGPTPAAGVWAGSQKLQAESDALGDTEGLEDDRLPKKQRTH